MKMSEARRRRRYRGEKKKKKKKKKKEREKRGREEEKKKKWGKREVGAQRECKTTRKMRYKMRYLNPYYNRPRAQTLGIKLSNGHTSRTPEISLRKFYKSIFTSKNFPRPRQNLINNRARVYPARDNGLGNADRFRI